MKKLFIALALMAAAVTTAHAASSNLVQNSSFEATKQTNGTWANYTNLPSWTGGKYGIELRNNVDGKASDGVKFVELDTTGNSSMSQTINNTTSDSGYILTFDYQNRVNTTTKGLTNGLDWQFGNVSGVAPALSDYGVWHTFSTNVVGLNGSTVLKFSATGISDSYGSSIDNVRVTPIPGAVWLFGSGLVGLVLAKHRKNHTV